MAPRIKVTAILSCDPSWRGLAFTLHVPSLSYNRAFLYDFQDYDKSKKYKHPVRTTNVIQRIFNDMFEKERRLELVDKIIMESQHKSNMQVLSWLISSNLMARLGKTSLEYISPLHWKAHFGIKLTGTHSGNKAAAVAFVEDSKSRLTASETVTEHNTADACLLLNSYLETTKNIIYKDIDDWSEMTEVEVGVTKFKCPECGNNSGIVRKVLDESKASFGKHFLTCWWTLDKTCNPPKKCKGYQMLSHYVPKIKNNALGKWIVAGSPQSEDVIEVNAPVSGQKRKTAPGTNLPVPKRPALAPALISTQTAALSVQQFNGTMKKAVDSLKDFNGERLDALNERMENVFQTVNHMHSKIDEIQNIITQIYHSLAGMGEEATSHDGQTQHTEQEEGSQNLHVPALPLEEGELDEISF